MQYILRGNYEAALQQLDGAKTSGASPAEVENLRGLALLLDGQTGKALAAFDRALQLEPALQAARFNRALALLRNGDITKAAAELQTIASDEHSSLRADAAYHLGVVLDRLGRPAEAETWLDNALKLDARLDAALLYVGLLRERRGDLQGAGRAYFEYLGAHPDSTVAMLRFARTAHMAGREDVAKTYLQKVVAAAPRSAEGLEAQKYLVMWE